MSGEIEPKLASMNAYGKNLVLATAFLGWMCAGMQMGNFILAAGSIVRDVRGEELAARTDLSEDQRQARIKKDIGKWFGYYIVAFLIGAACGGFLFGWLGDHFGRAKTMGLSILCYSLLHGAVYFADSLETILILRFLACFGVGGMWPTGVALVSEVWSNASRPFLAGLIGTSANLGIALMGILGNVRVVTDDDWRWLMVVSALPALLGFVVLALVPESPSWLAHRDTQRADDRPAERAPSVFRPPYLRLTLIGILLGTVPLLGGWGTSNWLPKWAEQFGRTTGDNALKAQTVWIGSSGAAIGSLLGGWLANLFGRKTTYFVVSLLAVSLSGAIFWLLSPADGLLFLGAVFVLRLVSTVYFGWLPLYLPELFPTRVRATGTGVTFNFGRILTAVGVLGTGALVGYFEGDYAKAGRITHLVFALGMIFILFAPDTSQANLDD